MLKLFWPAWVTRLAKGWPMDLETLNFLCVLYSPVPTSSVRVKALSLIADPYLTVKIGCNIGKILKITGQIAQFKRVHISIISQRVL